MQCLYSMLPGSFVKLAFLGSALEDIMCMKSHLQNHLLYLHDMKTSTWTEYPS